MSPDPSPLPRQAGHHAKARGLGLVVQGPTYGFGATVHIGQVVAAGTDGPGGAGCTVAHVQAELAGIVAHPDDDQRGPWSCFTTLCKVSLKIK